MSGQVSVIVIGFNHREFIDQLVESMRINAHEIGHVWFIDTGSRDGTLDAFCLAAATLPPEIRISTVAYPLGTLPTWALNVALDTIETPFTACISADDFFLPRRFDAQLAVMRDETSVQFLLANGVVVDERGAPSGPRVHAPVNVALLSSPPEEILHDIRRRVPRIFVQTALYRTEFLRQIGGWDSALLNDDWVLNLKAFGAVGPDGYRFVDEDVVAYRRHGTNASKSVFRQYMGQKQVIEKWLPNDCRARMLGRLFWSLGDYWLKHRQPKRARVFYGRARREGIGLWEGVGISFRRLAGMFGKSAIN